MTTAAGSEGGRSAGQIPASIYPVADLAMDEDLLEPTAGMVLHRVLALAARTFLLNDAADEPGAEPAPCEVLSADSFRLPDQAQWARTTAEALNSAQRRTTEVERVHQSRVALRRIRSNLRTFRLALDPSWGTSLRAELGWYGGRLGMVRDLHILQDVITITGPKVVDPEYIDRLDFIVRGRMAAALAEVADERGGERRTRLNKQMLVLWDGPEFKDKAGRPARDVLPPMLHRAWRDLRGAARTARKDRSDANLHRLRIRLKDLRYGCETVALVEGGPARRTAKAAERLQSKLGDLHDACSSIAWFDDLAAGHPDLREPLVALIETQQDAAAAARKGWNRELKGIERRWRSWQG
jgi:CHAD domain-containing protein